MPAGTGNRSPKSTTIASDTAWGFLAHSISFGSFSMSSVRLPTFKRQVHCKMECYTMQSFNTIQYNAAYTNTGSGVSSVVRAPDSYGSCISLSRKEREREKKRKKKEEEEVKPTRNFN